jgi:hypothetical protein
MVVIDGRFGWKEADYSADWAPESSMAVRRLRAARMRVAVIMGAVG